MKKRAIDLSMLKERDPFPSQKEGDPFPSQKGSRPSPSQKGSRHFHIAKNSQKAIASFDLFQRDDRPSCRVDMVWDKLI
jgi:hypothetical protein